MTTRLEGDPIDARWRSTAGGAAVVTIDLSPLSPADARSIARRFIDISSFADQCVERAGGNPLFLEQLLRGAGDLADGRLPVSIQSVVLARTDLLSARDRRAIQAASVLGQRFSLPQLRELLREPEYDCDTLVGNALLRPTQDGLLFAHALVRDGVYGSLTNTRSGNCTAPRPRSLLMIKFYGPSTLTAPAIPRRHAPISRLPKSERFYSAKTRQ